jgi:hypothetical protein
MEKLTWITLVDHGLSYQISSVTFKRALDVAAQKAMLSRQGRRL